ncbi:hypothetical protein ACN077_24725 [Clostridium chromiireducens]|uniref:hypothetical protein n=1 Tax=Clostridium chromiireducens TaxID=225345 RepID=UPI003AF815E4
MKNLIKWIKKHKVISVILSIIIILLPVLLIHILYKIKAPCEFFVAKWSAGELLQFYGAFLSFLGTVSLGALALWQNNQLAIKNQEFNELIYNQQKEMNMPRFDIASAMGSNGNFTNWYITLKNVSENVANKIVISSFTVRDKDENLLENKEDCNISSDSLLSREEARIEFQNKALCGDNLKVRFIISYEDKYSEKHSCEAKAEIVEQKFPKFKITPIE